MAETEKHIIKACLKGKREAQKTLFETYRIYLFGICMRYAKNKHEAEDMLQEGFYKILKDLKQFKGNASLKSWMTRVMINSSLMHIRRHRKLDYTELIPDKLDHDHIYDYSLANQDRATAIIKMVRTLPGSHQTVFNLRAIDGYSFREIATQLDIKEATARSHFLRARAKLQTLLHKEFH